MWAGGQALLLEGSTVVCIYCLFIEMKTTWVAIFGRLSLLQCYIAIEHLGTHTYEIPDGVGLPSLLTHHES